MSAAMIGQAPMLRAAFAVALASGCGNSGGFPDAPVPDAPPTATFSLTWSVVDETDQPVDCDRIAASAMTVITHNRAFDGGETQLFGCDTGMGQSQNVTAGFYDLDFELSGSFGLLAKGTPLRNVEIPKNTNTVLDPVVFKVQDDGGLALELASNRSGGNCTAPTGGAGIDAFSIGVTRTSDNSCIPVTFAISAGATKGAGTYTTTCPESNYAGGCIESDQTLTVTSMPSDNYRIRVRGKIGGTNCWLNNDTIQVPPLGQTLTRTLNLAYQMGTAGC
jgi:hypothetical protein